MADSKKRDRDDSSSDKEEADPKQDVFKKPKTTADKETTEEEEEECIGPLPSEAAKPKKKKGFWNTFNHPLISSIIHSVHFATVAVKLVI